MYDDHIAGLIEQLLLDKVNMRDLPRLLFQIAVILDINAAVGDHRSDGLGRVGVALGNGDADVSPFHMGGSLFIKCVANGGGQRTDRPTGQPHGRAASPLAAVGQHP